MRLFALFVGLGLGALAFWAIDPLVFPNEAPKGYYDLSIMPDDVEQKFADVAYVEEVARREIRRAASLANMDVYADKAMPEGASPLPFGGELYEPEPNAHWPHLSDAAANAALETASSGWIVMNLWTTWCGSCVKELPDMQNASPNLKELGFQLIAVNADPTGEDTLADAEEVFEDLNITSLPNIFTDGEDIEAILASTGIKEIKLPTNIIFAPGGEPFAYFIGAPEDEVFWNSDAMLKFFGDLAKSDVF